MPNLHFQGALTQAARLTAGLLTLRDEPLTEPRLYHHLLFRQPSLLATSAVAQRAMEMTGLEPVTLALQRRCSPN